MTNLNENINGYSPRLIENLSDIPFVIAEHLLNRESILRPKQREAVGYMVNKMKEDQNRAVAIIMPTATGKMVIVSRILAALKQETKAGNEIKRVLFVSDGIEGLKQAQDKMQHFAGIISGAYHERCKDLSKQVSVTTYNSWQRGDFPLNPDTIDLVILDEAHVAISDARISSLRKYRNAVWLALTASPNYDDHRSVLKQFELGYRMTIREAVEHKLICGFRNILLRSDIDVDLDKFSTTNNGDFSEKDLARALNTEGRNRIGGDYLLFGRHYDTGRPIRELQGIVSCVSISHAKDVASQIEDLFTHYYPGQAPEHGFIRWISGNSKNRTELLQWHREGKIRYLAFADLLNENYDDHSICICLNLRLSKSIVLSTQRGGRAERLDVNNPGKIALIVDVLDTYKGKIKKWPLLYSAAIGEVKVIAEEVIQAGREEQHLHAPNYFEGRMGPLSEEIKELARNISLRIVTEEESILDIINATKEQEPKEKSNGDLSSSDISKLTGLSRNTITRTFNKIQAEWDNHRSSPGTIPAPSVTLTLVRVKGIQPVLSITQCQYTKYIDTYLAGKVARDKTEDDLTVLDLETILGLGDFTIRASFKTISAEWDEHKASSGTISEPAVAIVLVKDKNKRSQAEQSIPRDKLQVYIKTYLKGKVFRKKDENELSVADITKLTGLSYTIIRASFKRIQGEWHEYEMSPKTTPKPSIFILKTRDKSSKATYTINKVHLDMYLHKYLGSKIASKKTPNDLTVSDIVKITGLSHETVNVSFRNIRAAWSKYEISKATIKKPCVAIKMVKGKNRAMLQSIRKENWEGYLAEFLTTKALRAKTSDDLTAAEIAALTGLHKGTISASLSYIHSKWKKYEVSHKNSAKPAICVTLVKGNRSKSTFTIQKDDLKIYVKHYLDRKIAPKKTSKDLTVSDIVKRTGLHRATVLDCFRKIEMSSKEYEVKNSTKTSTMVELKMVKDKKAVVPSISVESWKSFANHYLAGKIARHKTSNDLTAADVSKISGLHKTTVHRSFVTIHSAWVKFNASKGTIAKPLISITKVKGKGTQPVFAIPKDQYDLFISHYQPTKLLREKNNNDMTSLEVSKIIGLSEATVRARFVQIQIAWKEYERSPLKKKKPAISIQKVRGKGSSPSIAISRTSLPTFIQWYFPKKKERMSIDSMLVSANKI